MSKNKHQSSEVVLGFLIKFSTCTVTEALQRQVLKVEN